MPPSAHASTPPSCAARAGGRSASARRHPRGADRHRAAGHVSHRARRAHRLHQPDHLHRADDRAVPGLAAARRPHDQRLLRPDRAHAEVDGRQRGVPAGRFPRLGALRAAGPPARRRLGARADGRRTATSTSACTPARRSTPSLAAARDPQPARHRRGESPHAARPRPRPLRRPPHPRLGGRLRRSSRTARCSSLPEQPGHRGGPRHRAARRSSSIDNGATLQIGIGGIPNIVAQLLAAGTKGDFGIHTEMMVDGIMHLHQAGKITNHKGIYDGFSVATFAAGSAALYQLDGPQSRGAPAAGGAGQRPGDHPPQPEHGEHQRRAGRRLVRPGHGRHARPAAVLRRRRPRAVRHRRPRQRRRQEHHLPALDGDGGGQDRLHHRRARCRWARRCRRRATTCNTSSPSTASPTSAC